MALSRMLSRVDRAEVRDETERLYQMDVELAGYSRLMDTLHSLDPRRRAEALRWVVVRAGLTADVAALLMPLLAERDGRE